ncbi:MAG: efflux RND transporter periplasmic adaptor subunit [Flavisolibacter sp.]
MRNIFSILFLTALLILESCSNPPRQNEKEEQSGLVKPTWKLAMVVSDQPDFAITLPGELMPYEQVNIYPKIKSFIKKIYVDRGSYVYKGQLLAKLEAPEIGDQVAARQSITNSSYQKYLFSKQSYQRLKEASQKSGAVAAIELERAYAQLFGDSASYQGSRSEAKASADINSYLTIRAPIDGIVTGRYVSEGALVGDNATKSEPLFSLSQQQRLRLTVAIPEKEAQSLPLGTRAGFTVVDFPGKIFKASLSRNSGALDVSTRSVIAEFDISNQDMLLKAGQYAKVTITLKRTYPTMWVPTPSVVQTQSGVFVIKVKNSSTKRVPVLVGLSKDSLTEVFGNLKVGDLVLPKGSEEIKDGTSIKN